jgi:shikimate kinase
VIILDKVISGIVLIGMPGAGKSTIGILLAGELGLEFEDTDRSIEQECGKPIQELLDQSGYLRLRAVEEAVLLKVSSQGKVVATGGSAVYSAAGMAHLTANAVTVFLDIDVKEINRRITNFDERGIAKKPNQTLTELFTERRELYLRYSDIRLECNNQDVEQCLHQLIKSTQPFITS